MESQIINNSKRERTELIINNVYTLPVMPEVLSNVLALINNEKTTTSELSREISKDQSLVVKILSIANSPYYGLQKIVSSIDFAIMILGYSELQSIVTALAILELLKNKSDKYLDQKEFYIHSYLTGLLAKRIAYDLGYVDSDKAFIAGFIHDIGISIVHRFMHSSFVRIYEEVQQNNIPMIEAEKNVLGMTHEEVAKFLLNKWNLPDAISNAVNFHHYPSKSKEDRYLPTIVHISDYLIYKTFGNKYYWDKDLVFDKEVLDVFRFDSVEDVDNFVNNYVLTLIEQANELGAKIEAD
ncbi:HDOD domain-containing protein [Melioribacteraceae bacterium 4301-Me]|uniref:HDOD domain-containing protein n=1 Tax=Pyranulibacter aquaticus TaxID=3163344 RepID=UPI003595B2D3